MKKKKSKVNAAKFPPHLDSKEVAEIAAYYDSKKGVDVAGLSDHKAVMRTRPMVADAIWLPVPKPLVEKVVKFIATQRKSA